MEQKQGQWRRNAAAVIINPEGKILLGKDSGRNAYWHFPQGGAIGNEDIEHVLAREVWEEVGIRPTDYTITARLQGLRYLYPLNHSKSARWLGQDQTYFLLHCKSNSPKICVDRSPEFIKTKWFARKDIKLSLFPKFKRNVVQQVLNSFFSTKPNPVMTGAINQSSLSMKSEQYQNNQAINKYLVTPGKKLNLKDFASDDRSLYQGTKEDSLIEFDNLRNELQELQKKLFANNKHKLLIILQAMDAGGKDGCVKHVFSRIDPQGLRVVPFKKPTSDELAHDFLWRIHQQVPANGQIVVFNRSHYEDIIAVRVKKIFPDEVWKRRYKSVLDFEEMLADEGTTILKIFLNISKAEQKVRLDSRLQNVDKLWKFQMDDLDDRNRWDDFQNAYQDLIQSTATEKSPWYIIPGDRKWYRNLIVAQLIIDKIKSLNLKYPKPTFDPNTIVIPD
ncbi:MAG: NUDIX domain-containing protein [Akkermansia sp.]